MGKKLFNNIPSEIKYLVDNVRNGKIGLPDLQRPFVWTDAKVRDLFDSMMRGYPVGYVMLWESPSNYTEKKKAIGDNKKMFVEPKELVIDGQQRLTALVAAMYGVKVKDKSYKEREIKISYNPLANEFAVWSAAKQKDPNFVSKISDVYLAKENNTFTKFRRSFIQDLNDSRNKKGKDELSDNELDLIEDNFNSLLALENFSLPTLEISADATEEDVSQIFVRVNSGGQKLNENNFIQTLIAVYAKDTYDKISNFCETSRIPKQGTSFNNIFEVDPQHLVRMAVGLGFHRAKLKYAYMLLRGKDLDSGKYDENIRNQNIAVFSDSLEKVMNLNNWHAFLNCIQNAGYISSKLISASNSVVFTYVLYLIGKLEYKVDTIRLNKIISKWFFVAAVTYFYSNSTESTVEKQFADLRDVKTSDEFVKYLEDTIESKFTNDYFNVTLPNELNTSSTNSPIWNAYNASQIVLGNPILFGTTILGSYLLPGSSGNKNAIDVHHIFPKHFLNENGFKNDRDTNQIANYTYLEYATNIDISDDAPVVYIQRYKDKLKDEYDTHRRNHALPEDFETMDYMSFLEQRRHLMATIIREAFNKIK